MKVTEEVAASSGRRVQGRAFKVTTVECRQILSTEAEFLFLALRNIWVIVW